MKRRVGFMCEDAVRDRNIYTTRAILKAYTDTETLSANGFPDSTSFSVDRLVSGLERRGWKYDGVQRDARRPMTGYDTGFKPYTETIPELDGYTGDKMSDATRTAQNAEKRIKNVCSSNRFVLIMFGSGIHGAVLTQELYEAGWDWGYPLGV